MKPSTPLLGLLLASSAPTWAADARPATERIDRLEKELEVLKQEVNKEKEAKKAEQTAEKPEDGIKFGGAVRFQYSFEDYDADNRDRGGDIDVDTFRLDINGSIGDVNLSVQYRWYQYMNVVQRAYVGYQFNDHWEGQLGITKVPFGVLDYNSNNFFFSSGFYAGLEDDHDAGIKFIGKFDQHDLRIAFFKTDELGGIDGFVDNRIDRYSYDVVGVRDINNEGIFDEPAQGMAESNTFNLRYTYIISGTEVGASLQAGDLEGSDGSLGDHSAYAFHVKSKIDRVTIMFQFSDYEYDLDGGSDFVAVGAWSFHDTIPASAKFYNLNLSYSLPVTIGPISNLTFYNDYNLMTDKSGDLEEDTIMNVVGMGVTAGGVYTYVDLITARNQPFIGGSMAADADDWNTRFNINVGYYF